MKADLKQESRDHDYHHPQKNLSNLSRQSLLERIEMLEAKVAILSKENELYKKKDKETIWVSMNSMRKKPIQGDYFTILFLRLSKHISQCKSFLHLFKSVKDLAN